MQGKVYLDDNGEPVGASSAKVYLDDNGEPVGQKKESAKPEGKSITGFLSNAVSSTGKLIKDTAVGTAQMAKGAANAISGQDPTVLFRAAQAAPGAIKEHVSSRYGSLDKLGETAYSDPAGMLSDLSAVLSLGAGAATKAPKIAGVLRKAEGAVNPIRVAEPIAKATEMGTAAAVRPMLSPPKAAIRQQRAPLEIERTALKEGAVTAGGAKRKLGAAAERTTQAAKDATATGTTIPRGRVSQYPKTLDETTKLTPNLKELDDLAAFEKEVNATLPQDITPIELLERRRALDKASDTAYRAEERGGYIRGTRDKAQKELGGNMRAALRDVSPSVKESDDLARRLGLVSKSLDEANARPKGIPMTAALGAAGTGYFVSQPAAAAVATGLGIGKTFPQIPLALGSVPVRGTAGAAAATANAGSRQGLLLAALLERLSGSDQ